MGRVLVVGCIVVVIAGGASIVAIWRQGAIDEQRPVDAIVVLGAAQYDGRPSPVFEARLEHAVALWKAGIAGSFVVTGGKLDGDRTTEAAVARAYAIEHGVPASRIFGEDKAHNTLTSLSAVADELDARGMRSAVFVSDPTHMFRVVRIAGDLGIDSLWLADANVAGCPGPAPAGPGDDPRAGRTGRVLPDRRSAGGRAPGPLTPTGGNAPDPAHRGRTAPAP